MKQQKLSEIRDYKKNPRAAWEEPDKNYRSDLEFTEEDYKLNPTKQSEAEACDINNIMKRYEQTGLLPEMREDAQQYIDCTTFHDFHAAQEIVAHGKSLFHALPAEARAFFKNDPALMLEYVEDAKRDGKKGDKLVELGLAELVPPKKESDGEVLRSMRDEVRKANEKASKTKQQPDSGVSKDE